MRSMYGQGGEDQGPLSTILLAPLAPPPAPLQQLPASLALRLGALPGALPCPIILAFLRIHHMPKPNFFFLIRIGTSREQTSIVTLSSKFFAIRASKTLI